MDKFRKAGVKVTEKVQREKVAEILLSFGKSGSSFDWCVSPCRYQCHYQGGLFI